MTAELDLTSISRTVAARVHIAPGEAMSYVGDAWGKLDRRMPLNMQAEYLIRCAMGYALNEYARDPDIIDDIGRVPDESAPDEDDEAFAFEIAEGLPDRDAAGAVPFREFVLPDPRTELIPAEHDALPEIVGDRVAQYAAFGG